MDAYDFDTLLVALNPAVPQFLEAIHKARSKNMGIITMKVMARGILSIIYPYDKLLHYSMKYSDVAIVGCSNESDLEKNVLAAASYTGEDLQFSLDPDTINKASFFIKGGYKSENWPHTYQPDIPDIQS